MIIYCGGQVRPDGGRLGSFVAGMGTVTNDDAGHKKCDEIVYSGPYRPRWSVQGFSLSWAQHRLRVLSWLSYVKNCPFFLYEVEFCSLNVCSCI